MFIPIRTAKLHVIISESEFIVSPAGASHAFSVVCDRTQDTGVYDIRGTTGGSFSGSHSITCASMVDTTPVNVQVKGEIVLANSGSSSSTGSVDQKTFFLSMYAAPKGTQPMPPLHSAFHSLFWLFAGRWVAKDVAVDTGDYTFARASMEKHHGDTLKAWSKNLARLNPEEQELGLIHIPTALCSSGLI